MKEKSYTLRAIHVPTIDINVWNMENVRIVREKTLYEKSNKEFSCFLFIFCL